VSRSGFYAWLVRVPSQRAIRAERIEAKVAWFHGDSDLVTNDDRWTVEAIHRGLR